MADQKKQRVAFAFLRERAGSGVAFTADELQEAVGWRGQTATTYLSKHFASYVEKAADDSYTVIPVFRRVSWKDFQEVVTQVRHPLSRYNRATYQNVVIYDFLMPLTREDKLRKALDELFYRDTLDQRIREAGLDTLAEAIPRSPEDDDDAYVNRVIAFIDERVGGFSISHVSGRFRTSAIISREESAKMLVRDEPYLIDETTAVVRFIIPCRSSRTTHDGDFELGELEPARADEVKLEVQRIRTFFFELFVEALVPTIHGEKLIWMLETTPSGQRLYELDLVMPKPRGNAKDADNAEDEDDDPDSDETADDHPT